MTQYMKSIVVERDCEQMAARITELEAEVARLREAIKDAVEDHDWHTADPYDRGTCDLQGLRDILDKKLAWTEEEPVDYEVGIL